MPGKIRIITQTFPRDFVEKCSGLALDIGGTAVKFVYRSKEDWEKEKGGDRATLRFLTCGRDDLDAAIAQIKDDVLTSLDGTTKTKAYSCGLGGYQFNQKLQDAFKIEMENTVEGDCLIEASLYFFTNIPQRELLYPLPEDMVKEARQDHEVMKALEDGFNEKSKHKFGTGKDASDVDFTDGNVDLSRSMYANYGEALYPSLMVQLGSAYGWFTMCKETSSDIVDFSLVGGRTFLAVASLLTGVKSYDEFIDLAEKGDRFKVDQGLKSLMSRESSASSDDPYASFTNIENDQVLFSMGQAVFRDREDFSREDLAAAWLGSHLMEVARSMLNAVEKIDVTHVFVSGNLCGREYVRRQLTKQIYLQKFTREVYTGKVLNINVHFLRYGGHTGAFGALMNSVEKFTKDREDKDQES